MVFRFSSSNLIFNLQKNTIPVLAAHFPVTDDSELLIDHFTLCTSFLCLVGKKNKFLPHFITKHLPAHWRWNTMCSSVNNADPGSHPPWQRSTDIKQANSLVFQPLLLFFFFFQITWKRRSAQEICILRNPRQYAWQWNSLVVAVR